LNLSSFRRNLDTSRNLQIACDKRRPAPFMGTVTPAKKRWGRPGTLAALNARIHIRGIGWRV